MIEGGRESEVWSLDRVLDETAGDRHGRKILGDPFACFCLWGERSGVDNAALCLPEVALRPFFSTRGKGDPLSPVVDCFDTFSG